jgi:hydrogenase maturation protein HypF
MNKILTDFLVEEIKNKGLNVYIHREIPPNDGGISLGQAVICNKQP